MGDKIVVVTVGAYWALWWMLAVWFRRSWIPVIPFNPLILLLLGIGLNRVLGMSGAYVVLAIHLWLLVNMLKKLLAVRPAKPD
jgi:hypothetical protein